MDKVIVVTGASAGIGATFAELAGKNGAKVVLAARRKPALDAVAAAIGHNAHAVVTDVTERAQVERLAASALERFGRIDVWVNNAGRGVTRMVSALTDDDLDAMWRDNVKSALYGMQAVLPHFKERNAGQIINISSGLGRVPSAPFRSAYCAAKHGLNALTACLRLELMNSHPGIKVTLVSPGVVATDFGNNALGGGPDSRSLPGAQPVDEVAQVIWQAIETRPSDIYSAPHLKRFTESYYQDIDAVERQIADRFKP